MQVLLTSLCFFLVGLQDVVSLLVDDITSVDDLLSFLYDTAGQGNAVVKFVEIGFATLLVVSQVRRDIVVEIAFPQYVGMLGEDLVVEDLLLGRDDRVDL